MIMFTSAQGRVAEPSPDDFGDFDPDRDLNALIFVLKVLMMEFAPGVPHVVPWVLPFPNSPSLRTK